MKNWIIILVIIVGVSVIVYFVNKKPKTVIINKKPGEQWTIDELKTQGYTDAQIAAAQQTAQDIAFATIF